jgi:hypothetical protein
MRIKAGSVFDYESTLIGNGTLEVSVVAEDTEIGGGSLLTKVSTLRLYFTDVPEATPPEITRLGSQVRLNEGTYGRFTETGYRFTAIDPDGSMNPVELSVSGDPQDRFMLDTDGYLRIKANSSFDYETVADRSISLTITARDDDGPQVTTQTVTINFTETTTPNVASTGTLSAPDFDDAEGIGDTVTIIDGVTDGNGANNNPRTYEVYYSDTDFTDEVAFDSGDKVKITSLTAGTNSEGKPTQSFDLTTAMLEKIFYARVNFEDDDGYQESKFIKIGRHDISDDREDAISFAPFVKTYALGRVDGHFHSINDSDWFSFSIPVEGKWNKIQIMVNNIVNYPNDEIGVRFHDATSSLTPSFIRIDNDPNTSEPSVARYDFTGNPGDYFVEIEGAERIGDYSFHVYVY